MSIRLFVLAAFFFLPQLSHGNESDGEIVVVTSPGTNSNEIPLNQLRAIFVMRQSKWNDGSPVRVLVFGDNTAEHQAFSKDVLRFFPRQLRQAWDSQVFSGLGQYPEQVDSVEDMLAKIKTTPGSIGYIFKNNVNDSVRILKVRP